MEIRDLIVRSERDRTALTRDERVLLYLSGEEIQITETETNFAEAISYCWQMQNRHVTLARTVEAIKKQKPEWDIKTIYRYNNEANRLLGELDIQSDDVKKQILYNHLIEEHFRCLKKAKKQEELEEETTAIKYRQLALNYYREAAKIAGLLDKKKQAANIELPEIPNFEFTDNWEEAVVVDE